MRVRNRQKSLRPRWFVGVLAVALAWMVQIAPLRAEPETVELVFDTRTLLANLNEVAGSSKNAPLVLMVHGTFAHKDMELMKALQTALDERGVHSLSISLSYRQDRRTGPRECTQPILDTYADGRAEIAAWLNQLTEQGFKNIVLLGHSRGGARVAEFLAVNGRTPGVKGALLLAPATEEVGRFEREYRGSFSGDELEAVKAKFEAANDDAMFDLPGFLYCTKSRASASAIRAYYGTKQVRDTPTLLQRVGHTDVLVVAAGADAVIKQLPEKMKALTERQNIAFETIEDADHLFLNFFAEDAADLVVEFSRKSAAKVD